MFSRNGNDAFFPVVYCWTSAKSIDHRKEEEKPTENKRTAKKKKIFILRIISVSQMTMMTFLCCLWIVFLTFSSTHSENIQASSLLLPRFTILGALTNEEHIKILDGQTNRSYSISIDQNLFLSSQSFVLEQNPLLIAIKLCEIGFSSQAQAIIVGRGSDGNDLILTAISYVSDFYHVPVLTISSRENIFSDKVRR